MNKMRKHTQIGIRYMYRKIGRGQLACKRNQKKGSTWVTNRPGRNEVTEASVVSRGIRQEQADNLSSEEFAGS